MDTSAAIDAKLTCVAGIFVYFLHRMFVAYVLRI